MDEADHRKTSLDSMLLLEVATTADDLLEPPNVQVFFSGAGLLCRDHLFVVALRSEEPGSPNQVNVDPGSVDADLPVTLSELVLKPPDGLSSRLGLLLDCVQSVDYFSRHISSVQSERLSAHMGYQLTGL